MKKLLFYIGTLILIITLSRCMDGGSYEKYDVVLNLTSWSLPDTAKVSVPFNTSLTSLLDNSCLKNMRFEVDKYDNVTYRVYARAVYENHGEMCYDTQNYKDTTISITIEDPGKYYFYFLREGKFRKDSIVIKP
ncbi:MAG: hypothetical protein HXX16_03895 [Bacteroidales bacterium]|nr:hypothetical protein [Bacteroidales bacterium]